MSDFFSLDNLTHTHAIYIYIYIYIYANWVFMNNKISSCHDLQINPTKNILKYKKYLFRLYFIYSNELSVQNNGKSIKNILPFFLSS